jgi:hypothetical protein
MVIVTEDTVHVQVSTVRNSHVFPHGGVVCDIVSKAKGAGIDGPWDSAGTRQAVQRENEGGMV